MSKDSQKVKNEKQKKAPSSNKGNSQSMDTLRTTASNKNPDEHS